MLRIEVEAEQMHGQAADLDRDVRATRQFRHVAPPVRVDCVPFSGVGADSQRRPDMIEDDGRVGKFAGKVGEFGDLRMKQPRIERETVTRQAFIAAAKGGIEQQALGKVLRRAFDCRIAVPDGAAANALETISRGAQVGLEDRVDPLRQAQLGEADNSGANPGRTVAAACAHRRDAVDELGFAERREIRIAVGAIHRVALHEHRRENIVAGVDVGQELRQQIG